MIRLYMDVHIHGAVVRGLVSRGVDVVRAQDDGFDECDDVIMLRRATSLGRVLVTQDEDFEAIVPALQRSGERFRGVIYQRTKVGSVGQLLDDLTVCVFAGSDEDYENRLYRLPL